VAYCNVKGGLSEAKRPPFAKRHFANHNTRTKNCTKEKQNSIVKNAG
jgi:hypothetical protein